MGRPLHQRWASSGPPPLSNVRGKKKENKKIDESIAGTEITVGVGRMFHSTGICVTRRDKKKKMQYNNQKAELIPMDAPVFGRPCFYSVRMRRRALEMRWATTKMRVHPQHRGLILQASDCWPLHFRRRCHCPTLLHLLNCWTPTLSSNRCSNYPLSCFCRASAKHSNHQRDNQMEFGGTTKQINKKHN